MVANIVKNGVQVVAGGLPVLYVARNVACNVRGGFFRYEVAERFMLSILLPV